MRVRLTRREMTFLWSPIAAITVALGTARLLRHVRRGCNNGHRGTGWRYRHGRIVKSSVEGRHDLRTADTNIALQL